MFEDQIVETLEGLELGQPISHAGLTTFPLIGPDKRRAGVSHSR